MPIKVYYKPKRSFSRFDPSWWRRNDGRIPYLLQH